MKSIDVLLDELNILSSTLHDQGNHQTATVPRQAGCCIVQLRERLEMAIKLYAKARRISLDDAHENVRDALDI